MTLTPTDVLEVLTSHAAAPGVGGLVVCGCGRLTLDGRGQLEHTAQQVADAIHAGGVRLSDEPVDWLRAADLPSPGRVDDGARLTVPIAGGALGTVATGYLVYAALGRFGLVELQLLDDRGGTPRTRTVVVTPTTWIGVLP